ncbi:MAG: flippase-like domain-containing protein [Flavobacteriales bacterium]|nr:flippase-like domain-containing protein [Flavobacteriales bacterium]MBK7286286.1 flippase-like domain-containing protein [Flavobacteriales bacterium]MBK9060089.1 flippase-like domain-containing protein [Flavobacteriales bacterium]QQS71846.1 MAG: flippase-like domain-containing protein [Flavobacteriales bacterium]HQV39280.1 lysylphosphatidylglycerol synthase transmembrane domain-containing protein [Flavobacteriales bacterium]
MKRTVIAILKVGLPLAIGVWLVFYFYDALEPKQREELFEAFRQADLRWLILASFVGWLSHISRAWRWRYILEPMGYRPGFWNCYHAVMIGYFMNLFLPRAGEASRAVSLYRTEKVPFEKGFGTILAERAVDMLMLLGIAGVTLLLQLEKLDLFKSRIAAFRESQGPAQEGGIAWGPWIMAGLAAIAIVAVYLIATRPTLRYKVRELLRGFSQGLRAVFRTKDRVGFLLHTLIIWAAYVGMFKLGFYALPETVDVPMAGILAGFVAGAVGIVLVQGGIGVYPAFVALIVSIYMLPPVGGGYIRPEALAMGWLLWVAQTLMLIVLGGLSLLLLAIKRPAAK